MKRKTEQHEAITRYQEMLQLQTAGNLDVLEKLAHRQAHRHKPECSRTQNIVRITSQTFDPYPPRPDYGMFQETLCPECGEHDTCLVVSGRLALEGKEEV